MCNGSAGVAQPAVVYVFVGGLESRRFLSKLVLRRKAGRDEGMVLPIEQKDVVIDLSKPVPVSMTNLLKLTHATRIARFVQQVICQ